VLGQVGHAIPLHEGRGRNAGQLRENVHGLDAASLTFDNIDQREVRFYRFGCLASWRI